eukprot:2655755-Heterocapsa_arctica.AAC.1
MLRRSCQEAGHETSKRTRSRSRGAAGRSRCPSCPRGGPRARRSRLDGRRSRRRRTTPSDGASAVGWRD